LNTLQDFFAAHPALLEQFPGGVVQFAQHAGNMPEEVLQEIMVNAQLMGEVAAQGALPHGEMPGGLPGDNFVLLDFAGEADVEREDLRAAEGTPVADEATPALEESDEDEEEDENEDVEEVGLPVSCLFLSVLNHVRLRRCQFVSCVIWSAVSGVVPMPERKAHQKKDRLEKRSWMVWIEEGS
jgi:hypothetical protein